MNKEEFIKRLEKGLTGVLPEEQENAVQYYSEYFDDAGPEREAEVLAQLGDPDKLAADIKAASEPENDEPEKATQTGKFPGGYVPTRAESRTYRHPYNDEREQYEGTYYPANTGRKALFIAILVLLSPAILGIGIAGFVLLLVPFIAALAFGFSTAVIIIMGFLLINVSVANGLLNLGIALLLLTVTLLLVSAGVKLFSSAVPAAKRGCLSIYYRFTGMEGGYVQ